MTPLQRFIAVLIAIFLAITVSLGVKVYEGNQQETTK